jgi:hypothetical protein
MCIDLKTERPIPLSDIPDLPFLPRRRRGKKLSKATVFRWANPGVRGARLEVIRVGNMLCTSLPALQRFFERLAQREPTPPGSLREQRDRDLARVEEQLDQAGI